MRDGRGTKALCIWILLVTGCWGVATASEPAAPPLGEPPVWPIGMRLSDEMVGERTARRADRPADVLVWIPPGVERIRAMAIVPNNTDSKNFFEYAPLREVATRHRMAIVYLRAFHTGIEYHHQRPTSTPPQAPDNVLKLLELIAAETGMPEFRHAPWITFGKSSRGEFPFRMGWVYPQRTIATISYHGETPTWPIPEWTARQDQTILHVNAMGQTEWDGTWYRHVRPSLLNYRMNTAWLPHIALAHGVGHGNYVDAHGRPGWGQPVPEGTTSVRQVWDYLSLFVDRALTHRLPERGFPTNGPLRLRQLDPDSGYAVHPRAMEELLGMQWHAFRLRDGAYQTIPWPDEPSPVLDPEQGTVERSLLIRRTADVPEDQRRHTFWLVDRQLAEAWLKLHNVQNWEGLLPEPTEAETRAPQPRPARPAGRRPASATGSVTIEGERGPQAPAE